ncbi:MAG: cytochrome-c peroxidase [Ferruginibacter sp.]
MKKMHVLALLLLSGLFILTAFFTPIPPKTLTKVQLGKKLFEDKILSIDSSVSCSSCHQEKFAFADTAAFSKGIYGRFTKRNTPSVLNMLNRPYFFWDGRAASLEEQALMPIQNPDEMGMTIDETVKRLTLHPEYPILFKRIFKESPSEKTLAAALAAYEATLETVDSKFDDWSNGLTNLSANEEAGRALFVGSKAKCFNCHSMEDFTDDNFKNIGLYDGQKFNDVGRFTITQDPKDLGKFKTPGLRNIAVTAPYMHNGMFKTLEEVVDYYNTPSKYVAAPLHTDPDLQQPLNLSNKEKAQLVAFLKTLTDKKFLPKKGTLTAPKKA